MLGTRCRHCHVRRPCGMVGRRADMRMCGDGRVRVGCWSACRGTGRARRCWRSAHSVGAVPVWPGHTSPVGTLECAEPTPVASINLVCRGTITPETRHIIGSDVARRRRNHQSARRAAYHRVEGQQAGTTPAGTSHRRWPTHISKPTASTRGQLCTISDVRFEGPGLAAGEIHIRHGVLRSVLQRFARRSFTRMVALTRSARFCQLCCGGRSGANGPPATAVAYDSGGGEVSGDATRSKSKSSS